MTAHIIDGKAIAARLQDRIAAEVARLKSANRLIPSIAMILVGADPASEVYVRAKTKTVAAGGMRALDRKLPETISEADLLAEIGRLNADAAVHGILVQLPLPAHIDPHKVIEAIDPDKDIDGFHPLNAGRLARGLPGLVPCTPLACLWLARAARPTFAGLETVVVGRSNIVGKPVAQLMLMENTTVTIAHHTTKNLDAVCRRGDVLIVATGNAGLVRGDWIKPGAIVIDVGINRVVGADGKARIVGDVAFDEASKVASAITPVPGGVGPVTIACLLLNTLRAACKLQGVPAPDI